MITWAVLAGSHFSQTVILEGSKRSQTVLAEAKYDGHSQQKAKISGQVYTLWPGPFRLKQCMNRLLHSYLIQIHKKYVLPPH